MTPSSGMQTVFCPRGSSLLPLQTVINEDHDSSNFAFDSSLISAVIQKGELFNRAAVNNSFAAYSLESLVVKFDLQDVLVMHSSC